MMVVYAEAKKMWVWLYLLVVKLSIECIIVLSSCTHILCIHLSATSSWVYSKKLEFYAQIAKSF